MNTLPRRSPSPSQLGQLGERVRFKRWFGPSLLRRTVLALLIAGGLVWVVLSIKDYWAFQRDVRSRESLGRLTQAAVVSLQGFDAEQARWALKAADRHYNDLRRRTQPTAPGSLLFQLHLQDGTLVYRSAGLPSSWALPANKNAGAIDYLGVRYWPMVQDDGHWRLGVWVPAISDTEALFLIGRELLGYLLLALPLVALPMVLAVWLGLRPLHGLARQIALRRPDDLSPLQEPTGYVELAPLVEASNDLLERARRLRESEQTFVQDAAHELKTPLAVVTAQAHVLASACDEAQRHAALLALQNGMLRASHQVHQLLALAALDHAAPTPLRAVNLVEMVQDILIELEPLARDRRITLALQSPDQWVETLDKDAWRLVLVNLVRNAIQHGAEGGSVEVRLDLREGALTLSVSDDGPGIAAHERARVFDRFYRAESARSPGSGLGLAIVQRAAQRLRAAVSVEPGPGDCGVVVSLVWPAQ